jgi:biotin operon repressor
MTTYDRILKLLSDGNFHHSNEICSPLIGGRQGISRICELRKKGYKIEDRLSESGRGNEYKIINSGGVKASATAQQQMFARLKPRFPY